MHYGCREAHRRGEPALGVAKSLPPANWSDEERQQRDHIRTLLEGYEIRAIVQ
jgi:hypothetical protein